MFFDKTKETNVFAFGVIAYLISKHSFRKGGERLPDQFNLHCRHFSSPNPLRSHTGDCRNRALVRISETHPTPLQTLIAISRKEKLFPHLSF